MCVWAVWLLPLGIVGSNHVDVPLCNDQNDLSDPLCQTNPLVAFQVDNVFASTTNCAFTHSHRWATGKHVEKTLTFPLVLQETIRDGTQYVCVCMGVCEGAV